jgi:signal transduction histidine kinase
MQNTNFNEKTLKEQKELFTATVIHDLKTPLNAQIRSLELLKKGYWGKLNNGQKEILDIIIESSVFMKEMLYSLLEILKLENNFTKLNPETFDINQLMELCINEYKPLALLNNIFISYKHVKKEYISADKNLVRRIITNLLDNSIKYGFKNTTVYIATEENEKNIIINFKNTGYKISDSDKVHIFDKFSSFSELNQKPGIGLGLYYCKKAAEAHNGTIELVSDGNTNEFIVKLPKEYNENNYLNFV